MTVVANVAIFLALLTWAGLVASALLWSTAPDISHGKRYARWALWVALLGAGIVAALMWLD